MVTQEKAVACRKYTKIYFWKRGMNLVTFSQMVQKKSCICVCVYIHSNEVRQTGHEMGEMCMELSCTILAFLQFSKFKLHQSKNYTQKKECL